MPIAIKMPALSPTMEEGTLAKWLVKVGDTVSSGDIMAEIETDKATMEFEAVDEGVIAEIAVPEGTEGVKVGTVIATLAEEGEDPASVKASGGAKAEAPAAAPARLHPLRPRKRHRAAPSAGSCARPRHRDGRPRPASGDRVIASPLAKRIAADKGIDLATREGQRPQRPHRQGRRRGRAARRRRPRSLQPADRRAPPRSPATSRTSRKSSAACARRSRAA